MTALAVPELDSDDFDPERSLADLSEAAERVESYAGRWKSAATIKAYASGWRDFVNFCEARGLSALPALDQTVAMYLSDMADRGAKAATIARRLVVIAQAHKDADLAAPTSSSLERCAHAGIAGASAPPRRAKPQPWSPISR